jgi:hypothetical protein
MIAKPDPFFLLRARDMKYGQIAGNRYLNEFIYHCFSFISDDDEQKFVNKFKEQPHESEQIMHTVRELILGAYLGSCGFKVKYDNKINNQTPDWSILDDTFTPCCIIELVNFHIDKTTESDIELQKQAKRIALYWRDGNKDNTNRLYERLRHKSDVYQRLIEKIQLPYVIAIFGDIRVTIDTEEVQSCLFNKDYGLFSLYPNDSGVLYFEEHFGRYSFYYFRNPNCQRPFDISNSVFPK